MTGLYTGLSITERNEIQAALDLLALTYVVRWGLQTNPFGADVVIWSIETCP